MSGVYKNLHGRTQQNEISKCWTLIHSCSSQNKRHLSVFLIVLSNIYWKKCKGKNVHANTNFNLKKLLLHILFLFYTFCSLYTHILTHVCFSQKRREGNICFMCMCKQCMQYIQNTICWFRQMCILHYFSTVSYLTHIYQYIYIYIYIWEKQVFTHCMPNYISFFNIVEPI